MRIKLTLFILGLFMVAGCSHTDKSSVPVIELIGTEWGLKEIDGHGVADRVQSTLHFERGDRIVGWGGCNRYFADLRTQDDDIQIGPIGSTRRICPPVVMDQENRFFKVLGKARHISMQDSKLVIDSDGIEKPLKFIMIKH